MSTASVSSGSLGVVLQEAYELLASQYRSVLGICGFGGCGKTTLCNLLLQELGSRALHFETDWYLRQSSKERRARVEEGLVADTMEEVVRSEDPSSWYDWSLVTAHLKELKTVGSLKITNAWRQSTGVKDLELELSLPDGEASIIVCDGIYLLHNEIRGSMDRVVKISSSVTEAVSRAGGRDSHRSPDWYLNFKENLRTHFDVPYFEKYCSSVDVEVS